MPDGDADKVARTRTLAANVALAMRILHEASAVAAEVDAPPWQYAVDLRDLEEHGVTRAAIRWLIAKQRVETAIETTLPGSADRTFQTYSGTSLSSSTCLVLRQVETDTFEVPVASQELPQSTSRERVVSPASTLAAPTTPAPPVWNPETRELTVDGLVVKRFRVPAPNQELILEAFVEEGWPRRIDDPLPIVPGVERKRRLQATIVCLNRCQQKTLLRFRGDGLGTGIQWERVDAG